MGGLLPVWRGGIGVEGHVASARAVVRNGGVFVQMPEGTVSGPAGRIGPFRHGAALIAIRTGAPIVPLAMAGTEELYLGHRMASRVLPPTSAAELLGAAGRPGRPPRAAARSWSSPGGDRGLEAILGPVVEELHPGTVDPPSHPRRLRKRLTWRPRPGPPGRARPAERVPPYPPGRWTTPPSILDLVGDTPLVRINRLARDLGPADRQPLLLAKLEMSTRAGRSRTASACR